MATIEWGGWSLIDFHISGNPPVRLTGGEDSMMRALIAAKGGFVEARTLATRVASRGKAPSEDYVRTIASTLRSALGKTAIATRRGKGVRLAYRLVPRYSGNRTAAAPDFVASLISNLESALTNARRLAKALSDQQKGTL